MVGVAVNVTLDPEQIFVAEASMFTLAVRVELTVMVMGFEVAGLPDTHVALEVITQLITSPLFNDELMYVLLFVPVFAPFSFHWYEGVPPFAGVAVKVTDVPAQIVVALAAMLSAGTTTGFTVIVIVFDVAVVGVAHGAVEVITQLIISPFASEVFT